MRYISTRGQAPVLDFEETMLTGLARDGGLYVPETVPVMTAAEIEALQGQSYEEVAFRVMRPFIGDCFSDDEFRGIIERAYAGFGHSARCPLVQAGASTAATPPRAQAVLVTPTPSLASTATDAPARAAESAVTQPATPVPTTTTS